MILYALPQSPYCAKVRAALKFKGIAFDELEPAGGSYQTTEYQELVPAGSIPAIKIDDWVLHDSQAILEYLEEHFPEPSIWAIEPRARARQRAMTCFHDSRFEPKVRELVPLVKQSASTEQRQELGVIRDNLFDRLFRLDKMLEGRSLMGNDRLCAADWTYPPTIAIAEDILGHFALDLQIPPGIQNWRARAMEHRLVFDQVELVRGAIAQWLRMESEAVN